MKKVYLGGTCNDSSWREDLIDMLDIDYFNPVVDDWTTEAQKREILAREECDFLLYTLTPKMIGVYAIAEVVDDSNKRPKKTILCLLDEDYDEDKGEEVTWTKAQSKSLAAVANLVVKNGAVAFSSLEEVADYLNVAI